MPLFQGRTKVLVLSWGEVAVYPCPPNPSITRQAAAVLVCILSSGLPALLVDPLLGAGESLTSLRPRPRSQPPLGTMQCFSLSCCHVLHSSREQDIGPISYWESQTTVSPEFPMGLR